MHTELQESQKTPKEPLRLSKRLQLVASFVPEGSRIADIGTDHAYIPVYLAQTGRIASAIAMDVGKGPLERAKAHIEDLVRGQQVCPLETRLSDGLKELKAGEADTVIIAGMGGELVIRILTEGGRLWDDIKQFILSPQSDLDKVRHFLAENGFSIADESMVKDEGKFYTVMSVKRGAMAYERETEYLYGKCLLKAKNEVLGEYLLREEKRVETILASLKKPASKKELTAAQEKAVAQLSEELSLIKEAQYEMQ